MMASSACRPLAPQWRRVVSSEREFLSAYRNLAGDSARRERRDRWNREGSGSSTCSAGSHTGTARKVGSVIVDPRLEIMIRTSISLDQELYSRAKSMARRQGISLAELCRRSLRETVSKEQVDRPWMACAGVLEGEPHDSETVDDVGTAANVRI